MNLKATASFSVGLFIILLIMKGYPVLSANAFSRKASELQLPQESTAVETKTPTEHLRTPDQTFLTFPEWFLVFSPDELARYTKSHQTTDFPFYGHILQFWQGYGAVAQIINSRYPFNFGYHVMIMVIGTSTTAEYILRDIYENTVGRLTAAMGNYTEEDRLFAEYAKHYVDFIRVDPWYKYDFVNELKRLWTETSMLGPNPIRKLERKYYLTTEFLSKALYGWLIKIATHAAYDQPIMQTAVIVNQLPSDFDTNKILEKYSDGSSLVLLPRYAAFLDAVLKLSEQGATFKEIAGNHGAILLSILAPTSERTNFAGYEVVLTQSVLTEYPLKRFVIAVPISELAKTLKSFNKGSYTLEHLFDY